MDRPTIKFIYILTYQKCLCLHFTGLGVLASIKEFVLEFEKVLYGIPAMFLAAELVQPDRNDC